MVPAPEIHTSSTIEVPPIEVKISTSKRVFLAIVNWVSHNLVCPRLYIYSTVFVNKWELDLPPPKE